MKFICAWDNVACIIDNIPQDANGPVIVLVAMTGAAIIAVIIATIWSKL